MSELQVLDKKSLSILKKLKSIEERYQKLSEQRDQLKEQLIASMEKHGIKKWENDEISITYIPEGIQNRFDTTRFKKDHPETFELYQKETKVKASVRFTIKNAGIAVSK